MAVNYGGILGRFSGKVGSVVGQISRGQQIIKAYQPQINNPKSAKQQAQRKAFATAVYDINKICRDELPFLDKKLGNGKTMYGELVGFATKILRYKTETKQVPTKTVWESPLGDFGIDFKMDFGTFQLNGDVLQGTAVACGDLDNPQEMYIGIGEQYTPEEVSNGVDIYFCLLGLDENGRFAILEPDSELSAHVSVNSNFVAGGARPCEPQTDVSELEGYPYYAKVEPQSYNAITGGRPQTNGIGYMGVWGFFYDNLGNIYSIRQFGVQLRAQNGN